MRVSLKSWMLALVGAVALGCGGGGERPGGDPIAYGHSSGALVTDATHVYWTNRGGIDTPGALMKAPKAGGVPTALFTGTDTLSPSEIVSLTGSDVFLQARDSDGGSHLLKVPTAGGSAEDLFSTREDMTVIPSQGAFYVLTGQARSLQKVTPPERAATVIASELPWLWSWTLAEGDALYAITDKKDIVRQPLAGGPLETLATPEDGPAELVVAGGFLYWVGSGLRDNSWNVQPGTGSVMRRALAGGTPEPVAVGEDRPTGLRADERAVYWFSKTGDTAMLRSAPLAGGPARTLATGLYAPRSIRFSGNDLFFIEDYNILRISRDGGPLSSVGHTIFPSALTVDETHVYWSELTQVLRARKDRTLEPARPLAP